MDTSLDWSLTPSTLKNLLGLSQTSSKLHTKNKVCSSFARLSQQIAKRDFLYKQAVEGGDVMSVMPPGA